MGRQCRHRAGESRDLREDCEGGITLRAVLRIALCVGVGGWGKGRTVEDRRLILYPMLVMNTAIFFLFTLWGT